LGEGERMNHIDIDHAALIPLSIQLNNYNNTNRGNRHTPHSVASDD